MLLGLHCSGAKNHILNLLSIFQKPQKNTYSFKKISSTGLRRKRVMSASQCMKVKEFVVQSSILNNTILEMTMSTTNAAQKKELKETRSSSQSPPPSPNINSSATSSAGSSPSLPSSQIKPGTAVCH